jgi:PAS domain S-box-containing protein
MNALETAALGGRIETSTQTGSGPADQGLPGLFKAAFTQSKNAMALVDERRRLVDVNGAYLVLLGYQRQAIIGRPIYRYIADGPLLSPRAWRQALADGRSSGEAKLLCAHGARAAVQWAATTEVVTGQRLTLVVALSVSRWGAGFRRTISSHTQPEALTQREGEIVHRVALGDTGPEIAELLQISHATVRTHVRNAMTKTDARSRAHLVAKALGDGLVLDRVARGAGAASKPDEHPVRA